MMGAPRKIPVRVVRPDDYDIAPARRRSGGQSADPGTRERAKRSTERDERPHEQRELEQQSSSLKPEFGEDLREVSLSDRQQKIEPEPTLRESFQETDWKEQVLRLRADMDNYRKRQQRLAQEKIESEKDRLLEAFSRTVDDLERALESSSGSGQRLQQGVQIIHDEALKLLAREGVEKIEAENRPFDPNWHEAVMTVPSDTMGLPPQTVVRVIEPGYRRDGRLLKPAQVVVGV
jgi:molecular chaperone GrpE